MDDGIRLCNNLQSYSATIPHENNLQVVVVPTILLSPPLLVTSLANIATLHYGIALYHLCAP